MHQGSMYTRGVCTPREYVHPGGSLFPCIEDAFIRKKVVFNFVFYFIPCRSINFIIIHKLLYASQSSCVYSGEHQFYIYYCYMESNGLQIPISILSLPLLSTSPSPLLPLSPPSPLSLSPLFPLSPSPPLPLLTPLPLSQSQPTSTSADTHVSLIIQMLVFVMSCCFIIGVNICKLHPSEINNSVLNAIYLIVSCQSG